MRNNFLDKFTIVLWAGTVFLWSVILIASIEQLKYTAAAFAYIAAGLRIVYLQWELRR